MIRGRNANPDSSAPGCQSLISPVSERKITKVSLAYTLENIYRNVVFPSPSPIFYSSSSPFRNAESNPRAASMSSSSRAHSYATVSAFASPHILNCDILVAQFPACPTSSKSRPGRWPPAAELAWGRFAHWTSSEPRFRQPYARTVATSGSRSVVGVG